MTSKDPLDSSLGKSTRSSSRSPAMVQKSFRIPMGIMAEPVSHGNDLTWESTRRRYHEICEGKERGTIAALVALVAILVLSVLVTCIGKSNSTEAANALKDINSGDTAWVLVCSCLVLLMTPGLALFYGGMVQSKNMLSTIMQSIICMGIISILWIVIGFSLAFGDTLGGVIGSPATYFFYKNVGYQPEPKFAATIPLFVYSVFQMKFAIIVPAIVSGAFTERVAFGPYCLFVILFTLLIYCPMVHWVWHPDGFLRAWGVLDFAGGIPIETASGWAALSGSMIINRHYTGDYNLKVANPNIVFVCLGASLLWFGWLGFDGGSALAADGIAAQAFLNTNTSGAVAMLVWLIMDKIRGIKPSITGACVGSVVGLVCITPACGYLSSGGAIVAGIIGAMSANVLATLCHSATAFDDQLEVFPAHGLTGTIGLILTGCLADSNVNPTVKDGLFYGGYQTFYKNLVAAVFSAFYAFSMSYAIWKFLGCILDIHVSAQAAEVGLDYSIHGEFVVKGLDRSSHGELRKNKSDLTLIKEVESKALTREETDEAV